MYYTWAVAHGLFILMHTILNHVHFIMKINQTFLGVQLATLKKTGRPGYEAITAVC